MRWLIGGLALALFGVAHAGLGAGEGLAPASKCVSIEIVLADTIGAAPLGAAKAPTPLEITPERIQALESQGKLEALGRIRLVTLENLPAMIQFRETIPVATRQTMRGGGGPGGGGPVMTSYQMQDTGTVVDVTPRVEEDGAVVLDLKVECSRLARGKPGTENQDNAAAEFVPPSTLTVTAKSTLRIAPGKTVVTAAEQTSAGESRRTWILVSAKILDAS